MLVEVVDLARKLLSFSSLVASSSPMLCIAGVAILFVSFSVDTYDLSVYRGGE